MRNALLPYFNFEQMISGMHVVCEVCGNLETNSTFEFRCPDCGTENDANSALGVAGVLCEMCGFHCEDAEEIIAAATPGSVAQSHCFRAAILCFHLTESLAIFSMPPSFL